MKWLRSIVQGIDVLNEIITKINIWLIAVITSIIFYHVVLRYFFNAPTIWASDLSGLLFGLLWLLTGGYVLSKDGHVRMDLFYRRLTPRKQAIIDVVTYTLFFFYCGLILIHGWEFWWLSFIRETRLGASIWKPLLWPFYLAIPIGMVLILLAGMAKYIRDLYTAITGRQL
jgi:TRAP-type mannitol/chloroaromatic compound transport system permease small subunit